MPTYTYKCEQCGGVQDAFHKMSETKQSLPCSTCKTETPVTKVIHATSFVLKGGGWFGKSKDH